MKNLMQIFAVLCFMFFALSCEKENDTEKNQKENYETTIAKRKAPPKAHVYFHCDEHQEEHNIFLLDGRLFHDWGRWEPPTEKTSWFFCNEHKENHIRILQDKRVFDDIGKDEIDDDDI